MAIAWAEPDDLSDLRPDTVDVGGNQDVFYGNETGDTLRDRVARGFL
jgi:hypothetical protein